tara:strand:- start:8049 stop:8642 length:594 start_codon:yes stop_codon:yes gene_type:complete
MTAQVREILIYKWKRFSMVSEPFSQYIKKNNIELRLHAPHSALRRGYIGKWEIKKNKLFLKNISGKGEIKNQNKFNHKYLDLKILIEETKPPPSIKASMIKTLENECFEEIELSIKNLFNSETKVFADWYSGTIRCPYGKLIHYVHTGYESLYSKELLFNIKEGIIIDVKKIKNELTEQSSKHTPTPPPKPPDTFRI